MWVPFPPLMGTPRKRGNRNPSISKEGTASRSLNPGTFPIGLNLVPFPSPNRGDRSSAERTAQARRIRSPPNREPRPSRRCLRTADSFSAEPDPQRGQASSPLNLQVKAKPFILQAHHLLYVDAFNA